MCGRFVFFGVDNLNSRFNIDYETNLNIKPSYNISPSKEFPVIYKKEKILIEYMKWGLIPSWTKELDLKKIIINARSETLYDKPAFKSLIKKKRCLIPSNGFYEWKLEDRKKIPYYISLKNNSIFAFAGLYDSWIDGLGTENKTFTIITTKSNSLVETIHSRMPVILVNKNEERWLDENIDNSESIIDMLKPYNPGEMKIERVSMNVNNPGNDYFDLIKSVS